MKTCNGCKALNIISEKFNPQCKLGFRISYSIVDKQNLLAEYYPVDKCPKPLTNKEYVKLLT